jgi:hypothetical protein
MFCNFSAAAVVVITVEEEEEEEEDLFVFNDNMFRGTTLMI